MPAILLLMSSGGKKEADQVDCKDVLQLLREVLEATVETVRCLPGPGSIWRSYTIQIVHGVYADVTKLGMVFQLTK